MLVSDSGSLFLSSGVILAIILKEFVPKIKIVLFFVFLLFFFFLPFSWSFDQIGASGRPVWVHEPHV